MVSIHKRPAWAIAESLATPESVYLDRRKILAGMGLGGIAAAAMSMIPTSARGADDPTADLYPAMRNEAFKLDRELTPEEINGSYNNFYEFGSHKSIAAAAQSLVIRPWDIEIDGMVEKPMTVAFDDLVRKIPLEERLYRHRCVEAWSMTVPWTGFTLAKLVEFSKPLGSAKYIRFETFLDPSMASGQRQVWYPWPYVEGVTMEEAMNDLSFMVTGAYGKPAAKQFGAPIRLALPWKYGFKSIKSIKKITFTDKRPRSFWEEILPEEYGFWANVNPEVPHRRWSQAEERILHTGEKVPTLLYNGYGAQVAHLYKDLQGESLFM
ncbi:MAG: protein-methionine-sulfoxide reductase catalytic subunit MsrP [Rhizobiaceae bacterium]